MINYLGNFGEKVGGITLELPTGRVQEPVCEQPRVFVSAPTVLGSHTSSKARA